MSLNTLFSSLTIQTRGISSYKHINPKKFISILQDVPAKPRSAWQLFIRENVDVMKGRKEGLSEAAGELSATWKQLSEKDKKKYSELYKKEYEAHVTAYNEVMQKATPKQIFEENLLRKKYKLPLLKDPKKPKKPINAYLRYYIDTRKTSGAEFLQLPMSEQAKSISEKYKTLSDSEKEKYVSAALEDTKKYRVQLDKYNQTIKNAD